MSDIKQKIEQYISLEKEIHDYFGYVEDWVTIPMDFHIGDYWMIMGDVENGGYDGKCVYSPEPFTKESIQEGMKIYSCSVYTQRFLPKWVYRGPEFMMVSVDTRTDGNKYLMIFENDKECKDQELKELYMEYWGSRYA